MTTKKIGVKETKERGENHGQPILFAETEFEVKVKRYTGIGFEQFGCDYGEFFLGMMRCEKQIPFSIKGEKKVFPQ